MALLKLGSLLLLGLVLAAQCAPQKKFRRNMVRGRPSGGFVPKPTKNENFVGNKFVQAGVFSNKVDHFNTSNSDMYSQVIQQVLEELLMEKSVGPDSSTAYSNLREKIQPKSLIAQLNKRHDGDVMGVTQTLVILYAAHYSCLVDFSNKLIHKERYWYNDQWYKEGGSAFLMLGGESGEDPYWVEDGTLAWTQMAADNGAMVFLLEHRYYGLSRPTSDMSTPNLVYLSSAQALEDMVAFIGAMKTKFPNLMSVPWVTFGGSYSGALAAWARVKHPELIAMAVGSSGPVQAEVDFVEYLEVVQNSITRQSQKCGQSVTTAFNQVASLLQTASGRKSLQSAFNLCQTLDPTNAQQIENFWQTVYSPYMEIVQYTGDNAGLFLNKLTIKNAICRFHENDASTSLTKLKEVNDYFNALSGYFGCEDIDYQSFIDFMKDTTYGEAQEIRAWVWQTCTEFGYYQSTDSDTAGPYFGGKPALPVQFYIDECTSIYGSNFNSDSVASAVANVNAYYGGRDNMDSSYIILPNGDVDPWHALGKLESNSSTIIPVVIEGTAHCADMYATSINDLPSMTAARKTISSQLMQWIRELDNPGL